MGLAALRRHREALQNPAPPEYHNVPEEKHDEIEEKTQIIKPSRRPKNTATVVPISD